MVPDDGDASSTTDTTVGTTDEPGLDKISSDERMWGILVHASGFVGMFIPLGNIIAPLLIWLIKKEESQFVDENGKNAVNFQITWTIYLVISALSIIVLIGFLLLPLVILGWLILVILGAIRASNNTIFEYPLTIKFIS